MIKWLEPLPKRFYCPLEQYQHWNNQIIWLGDTIQSPGGSYTFIIKSAPCCPLYWGNGRAEMDRIQMAWVPENQKIYDSNPIGYKGKWKRSHNNYLAYWVSLPYSNRIWLMTVRWQSPN